MTLPNPPSEVLKKYVEIREVKVNSVSVLTAEHKDLLLRELRGEGRFAKVPIQDIEIHAGQSATFELSYVMAKEIEDTELLRVTQPTDSVDVRISDYTKNGMIFQADSLRQYRIEALHGDGDDVRTYRWRTTEYLLPWQGVLFWWKIKPSMVKSDDRLEDGPDMRSDGPSAHTRSAKSAGDGGGVES